jgi:hypothetical protein
MTRLTPTAAAPGAAPVRPLLVRHPWVYCGLPQHIWEQLLRAGEVPPPVDLPGRPLWRAADLDRWVAGLKASQRRPQPGGPVHA